MENEPIEQVNQEITEAIKEEKDNLEEAKLDEETELDNEAKMLEEFDEEEEQVGHVEDHGQEGMDKTAEELLAYTNCQ